MKRIVVIQIDELEYDLAFDKNLFVLEAVKAYSIHGNQVLAKYRQENK